MTISGLDSEQARETKCSAAAGVIGVKHGRASRKESADNPVRKRRDHLRLKIPRRRSRAKLFPAQVRSSLSVHPSRAFKGRFRKPAEEWKSSSDGEIVPIGRRASPHDSDNAWLECATHSAECHLVITIRSTRHLLRSIQSRSCLLSDQSRARVRIVDRIAAEDTRFVIPCAHPAASGEKLPASASEIVAPEPCPEFFKAN